MKNIVLAGGCFWGVEAYFERLNGVISTKCGYANGNTCNPSYHDVKTHLATHAESVMIEYDEDILSLTKLLEHFLRFVDPYTLNHQGEDYGIQYRSGIYYKEIEDRIIIKDYITSEEAKLGIPFVIEIEQLQNFYDAETEHQHYLQNHPTGYCHINLNLANKDELK